jgi:hypothetical protein
VFIFTVFLHEVNCAHCPLDGQQADQETQYMRHRMGNYIDVMQKHCKHENTDRSSAGGTAVPLNFNDPNDGRIGRNM